jgi:hypothetical protein
LTYATSVAHMPVVLRGSYSLEQKEISDLLADILDKVCQGVVSPKGYARFLLITVSNLSQASPLGGLSAPHDAFQGHAAHPPRWFGELSPKGSSGTCIPEGDIAILICRFHGARYATTSHRAWPPRNSETRCRHRSARPGPATPLAVCRCAGGPSGYVAMTVSVPCRCRFPMIA